MHRHGKDAFDRINVVQYYDQGPDATFKAFAEERHVNPVCADAITVLDRKI